RSGDIVHFGDGSPAPPAQPSERLVDDDPGKPGRQRRLTAEPVEMREGADIGLLHDVLRLVIVADDAARDPVELPVVRSDDQPALIAVARPRPDHQLEIGRQADRPGNICADMLHERPRIARRETAETTLPAFGWNPDRKVPGRAGNNSG